MSYCIEEHTTRHGAGLTLRGAALQMWRYRGHESILAGPAETGKTIACLHKLDALLWKYPGAQAVMCRKVRDTIHGSCLQSYVNKVLAPDGGVRPYGGERPQWFDYPNGSRLWIAGLDDPGKALSSERDFVYVNQAEDITERDWGVLLSRATGRAGNAPYAQVFGDCNPGPPTHWILARESAGRLRVFHSRHEDNPTLFDDDGQITEQGRRTLEVLDALPGILRDRLRFGRWVAAEGVIYDGWHPAIHISDLYTPDTIPVGWPRLWVTDFGFTNPFCWLAAALDGDGRLWVYRQIYLTKRMVSDHAERIRTITANDPPPVAWICDPEDAEGRATLTAALGISTIAADKHNRKKSGIQAVQMRLRVQPDGRPRIYFVRGNLDERDEELSRDSKPTRTEEEFPAYVRRPGTEDPLDTSNHGMDCLRYLVSALDAPLGGTSEASTVLRA